MKLIQATIAAILVQPLLGITYTFLPIIGASENFPYSQILSYTGWVLVFASLFVIALGIPTYYLLKRYGKSTRQWVAFAGFALSATPTAILGWPRYLPGYSSAANWHGTSVELYIDGAPTMYAWLTHFESIFWFGLHGFVGALIFHFLISRANVPRQGI